MSEIYDVNGTRIQVGAGVIHPEHGRMVGTVIELTDPDGDVNIHGRPVARGPYVIVRYDDGETVEHLASWNATGPWDDHRIDYTCDDVQVAK